MSADSEQGERKMTTEPEDRPYMRWFGPLTTKDDELIRVYGEENVKDFRMWLTQARLSCDPLTPHGWAQLTAEDKKKIMEILERPLHEVE